VIDLLPSDVTTDYKPTLQSIGHYRALFAAWCHVHQRGGPNKDDHDIHVFYREQHAHLFRKSAPSAPAQQIVHSNVVTIPGSPIDGRYRVKDELVTAPAVYSITLDYHGLASMLAARGYVHQDGPPGSWVPTVPLFDFVRVQGHQERVLSDADAHLFGKDLDPVLVEAARNARK
jgi:hypothetical protein